MEIEYIESFGLGILSWIIQRLFFIDSYGYYRGLSLETFPQVFEQWTETLSLLISGTLMFVAPIVLFALAPNIAEGLAHAGLYIIGVSVGEVLDQTFFGYGEGGMRWFFTERRGGR